MKHFSTTDGLPRQPENSPPLWRSGPELFADFPGFRSQEVRHRNYDSNQPMISGIPVFLIVTFLVFRTAASGATMLLATGDVLHGYSTNAIVSKLKFALGHSNGEFALENTMFESIVLGPSDVGTVFIADAESDADFALFESRITNGANDLLLVARSHTSLPPGEFTTKEQRFENTSFAPILNYLVPRTGPDLFGYNLTRVEMEVISVSFDSPGTNPNGDGVWTDFSGVVRFRVYGDVVPETSAAALVFLGFGSLVCRRRRPE